MNELKGIVKAWLADINVFSRIVVRRRLYAYQLEPARAIVDSVLNRRGLEFAVLFPRQSGKNELQVQLEAYLLNLFQCVPGAAIVKAQPTYVHQGTHALGRLKLALNNPWNEGRWRAEHGSQITLGQAAVKFYSADPAANPVGASATLLLECDEAQDVLPAEWDKKFMPMGASTNVTVVYWGTAWTSRTLLATTIRTLRQQEARDGLKRVFIVTPEQVALENPAYGEFVARQIAKKGRDHPLIKTQYFNEDIDMESGMYPPTRRALMQGVHPPQTAPIPGRVYALLIDIAGEDEGAIGARTDVAALENPKRDSTVLTIVEVDLTTLVDPIIRAPTYLVVRRQSWIGSNHTRLYAQFHAIAALWRPVYVVADNTGVGAGLVSFLKQALPAGVVVGFQFSSLTKSDLGWDYLNVCDTGRWLEYQAVGDAESATFFEQLEFCRHEVMPGAGRRLKWGVPDGTRNPISGELVHDDAIVSAALGSVLDHMPWHVSTGPTHIIPGRDPLDDMSRGY